MGASLQNWFDAAKRDNIELIAKHGFLGSTLSDPSSPHNGLAALHLAVVYGSSAVYQHLCEHERGVLTAAPVVLFCPRLGCKIALPAGLSQQHVLAVKNRAEDLAASLARDGVVYSPVPLLSCCLIGLPEDFSRQNQKVLLAQLPDCQLTLFSPVRTACVLGLKQTLEGLVSAAVDEATDLECGDSAQGAIQAELCRCAYGLEEFSEWAEARALKLAKLQFIKIEACKDILRRRAGEGTSLGLRRSLSVLEFVTSTDNASQAE